MLKRIKGFFATVWFVLRYVPRHPIKSVWWINEHLPMWVIYNIMWGAIAGSSIYGILGHYLGHGVTAEQAAMHVVAVSPFAAWAIPAGLFFGIGITVWLFYWDFWAIRKYGSR